MYLEIYLKINKLSTRDIKSAMDDIIVHYIVRIIKCTLLTVTVNLLTLKVCMLAYIIEHVRPPSQTKDVQLS